MLDSLEDLDMDLYVDARFPDLELPGIYEEIMELLFADEETEEFDEEYFNNKFNVYHDLCAFASEMGRTPWKLSTSENMFEIRCMNGRRMIFATWLRTAGIKRVGFDNVLEAGSKLRYILDKMLQFAGFMLRDSEYYTNAKFVRRDLLKFQEAMRLHGTTSSIPDNFAYKITCCNGEEVNFYEYVSRAGVEFGMYPNIPAAFNSKATIRKKLYDIAGL